jgi:small-conductance mechanosensitive channel/CRP-like cAMP-binding protein
MPSATISVMNPVLIPAAALVAITAIGLLSLRRFSDGKRFLFDISAFAEISAYFLKESISPFFPPLVSPFDNAALWMRAIGGAWWLLGGRIAVALMRLGLQLDGRTRQSTLFSDLFGAVIYIATALVILNSVFLLPVTGLLATSGVLAIVLGLALQNTLADVFAGMAVSVEKPFSVGDRIQIDNKIEGHVAQMNWRSIRIRTDGDDIAIVPNSQIAKSEIVNRSCPGHRRATSVQLGCSDAANPERVIELLHQATLLCPDILRTPEPKAFLTQMGAPRNVYTVSFFVESTKQLSPAEDILLRCARRQLYYAGLLNGAPPSRASGKESPAELGERLLGDLVLLECLTTEQLHYLSERLVLHLLEPGETLFVEGSADDRLYVVATGILEIACKPTTSPAKIIGRIGAGEYVGELGLLTGAAHSTTATARTYCKIYHLPRDAIAPLLAENPNLADAFNKSLRHSLNVLHQQTDTRAAGETVVEEQFLHRIRHFFRSPPIQPDP